MRRDETKVKHLADEILDILIETRGKLYTSPELASMISAKKNTVDNALGLLISEHSIVKTKLSYEEAKKRRVGGTGSFPEFAYHATPSRIEKELTKPGRATQGMGMILVKAKEK